MSSFSAAGEDLVPEPPLQAQAAGEGEGNDRDSGRVGIGKELFEQARKLQDAQAEKLTSLKV